MPNNTKLMANGDGLIVPMNIEAVCVNEKTGAIFRPAPYNFAKLPSATQSDVANLSERVMTGDGLVTMSTGVHLHWALPDGLTRGTSPQDTNGTVIFPNTPDRWLITRIYSDQTDPTRPTNKVKSWVVESNYITELQSAQNKNSIAVPFKTDSNKGQQYRFLGRVQEYETWCKHQIERKNNPQIGAENQYVEGLTAIGYGSPQFSASYHTAKSTFGFHDTELDLDRLAPSALLSYHVVGWYNDLANDPLSQLPLQLDPVVYDQIIKKIVAVADQITFEKAYQVLQTGGTYVLAAGLSSADKIALNLIMGAAGFSFLNAVLKQAKWSLPSGTIESKPHVSHTLITGLINNVAWNKEASYANPINDKIDIALGNTASQALAALIASVSDLKNPETVELLLDALQLGKLQGLTDVAELSRLEELAVALHTSGYNSVKGGTLWEVNKSEGEDKRKGLTALAGTLGSELNQLNELQLAYDAAENEIESTRTQIFMDWYRFMLVLRPNSGSSHGMKPMEIAELIVEEINGLKKMISSNTLDEIETLAGDIKRKLPAGFELLNSSAARYWQPTEPVILFHGEAINPPQRYGGDGRFMHNNTMVCRLSSQLLNSLSIPANVIGNAEKLEFNKSNLPTLSNSIPLDYSEQIQALFTESCLINPSVMANECIKAGAKLDFNSISAILQQNIHQHVSPKIVEKIPLALGRSIELTVSGADFSFFLGQYALASDAYIFKGDLSKITPNDSKRLAYIFVSSAITFDTDIEFAGLTPSPVYFVTWKKDSWLPFSFSWEVYYHPFDDILPETKNGAGYAPDFILNHFSLGDVNYKHKGAIEVPKQYQSYSNTIFMSPHAEENFQVQIRKFIDSQPFDPLDEKLAEILEALKDFPPILSQSLNGLNDHMVMRNQVMQLQVKDPVAGSFNRFTNVDVNAAVGSMTKSAPSPGKFYNPIRAGLMKVAALTIIDVFGRTVKIEMPNKITMASNFAIKDQPKYAYLSPRIVQPSRLMFRWLAASNAATEMNSHPSTTAICGWILSNHLDSSLWFYDNDGSPLGALILSEDYARVIWQPVPGSNGSSDIVDFFNSEQTRRISKALKDLAIALYDGGNGGYLSAFMRANDTSYQLIQPKSYKQLGGNAVLMGSPIAVAQASLSLDLQGLPAYSMGWDDFRAEVQEEKPKNDKGFTHVKFPVRLGNMKQVDDGLLGYFKKDNYAHYYAVHTKHPTAKVTQPDESNITLAFAEDAHETVVTLLFDPRCAVHATTGLLPVKKIDLPPAQFADALESLEIAFLATPILYNQRKPAFPVPAVTGGAWTWLQNELLTWSESQSIAPVDDRAEMTDSPQEIKEGWLLLNNFTKSDE